MQIESNFSLKPYNTFGIAANARWFGAFTSADELGEILAFAGGTGLSPGSGSSNASAPFSGRIAGSAPPLLILGGGSNILLTQDFPGLVLANRIRGIDIVREDENYVYVQVGAGEEWQPFVEYSLQRNWQGAENLSLIPGNTGASPMQNIGAYGVELKDIFYELKAWRLDEGKIYTFSLNDCEFGYRDSIFKRQYRGQFVILDVTFRLNKIPKFRTEYGAIRQELETMGISELSSKAISEAVIRIRRSRLPDPAQIGNAGSFFKNPTIPNPRFGELQAQFPGIVGYPNPVPNLHPGVGPALSAGEMDKTAETGTTKLAAGWLIEQCGWKGYRRGDAGCHERQALVLVNYGRAGGREIYDLSTEILLSVRDKFGVELEREVNVI